MADHIRQQIRDRAVTTCTGLTTTGANVFQSPIITAESQTLPALLVYISNEDVGLDASMGILQRQASLEIHGYVEASATVFDTLDLISKEVEIAIAGDRTLNSLVQDTWLQSTEIVLDPEGSRPLGIIQMSFYTSYRTTHLTPDVSA